MFHRVNIEFDSEKSAKLKAERGIGFDEIVALLDSEQLLEVISHPNSVKYPNQKVFVMNIEDYIYWVPFVKTEHTIFLKTIFRSRKATAQYLKKTVKRKFTLGKSDKLRRISVLIKDRQTRKNIINTQKELKKTNITDVRKYLRQHGIIKVGSTCPTDILRKTFESAVLSG